MFVGAGGRVASTSVSARLRPGRNRSCQRKAVAIAGSEPAAYPLEDLPLFLLCDKVGNVERCCGQTLDLHAVQGCW